MAEKLLDLLDMQTDILLRNFYTDTNLYTSVARDSEHIDNATIPVVPPKSDLAYSGPTYGDVPPRRKSVPLQGQLRRDFNEGYKGGNLYDDGALSVGQRGGPFGIPEMPLSARKVDPFAIAHWLRNIGREFGVLASQQTDSTTGQTSVTRPARNIAKGIQWAASQFLLASFNITNPEYGGPANAIWNPLSMPASAVPFSRGQPLGNGVTVASATGHDYKTAAEGLQAVGQEKLLRARKGAYADVPNAAKIAEGDLSFLRTGVRGVQGKVGQNTLENPPLVTDPESIVTIEQQVDKAKNKVIPLNQHVNPYTSDRPYNQQNAIFPLEKEFKDKTGKKKLHALYRPFRYTGAPSPALAENQAHTWIAGEPYDRGMGPNLSEDVSMAFPEEDETATLKEQIEDEELYMPFMFQDLRDNPPRFLYFRAFLKEGLSENFTPDWNVERFYGRVDQIPTYQGTIRNISLSFDVMAFAPEDLSVMWKKLQKLQSMTYPTFDTQGFLQAGPILRMRVGDLISSGKNGLPGYITSLDFAYDDGIWNIEPKFKVPRKVSVSLGYTVIHEQNPGIYPSMEWISNPATDDAQTSDNNPVFGAGRVTVGDDGTLRGEAKETQIRRAYTSATTDLLLKKNNPGK